MDGTPRSGVRPTALAGETSGALGDLGTLLPLLLGAVTVGGLAPGPVLAGFGATYLLVAVVYRLPVPVQPMKAIAALVVTGAIAPAALAASGVVLGAVLLILGLTGAIARLARAVPRSVLTGLQLGLGLSLGLAALGMMAGGPTVALITLGALSLALVPAPLPVAGIALAAAVGAGLVLGQAPGGVSVAAEPPAWPSRAEIETGLFTLALPQLALTLSNAVLLTALVAGDCFGPRAARVTPRRLCLTSGIANLALAPLGAMPMCHGAGGLVAHHRFGARGALAPCLLGGACLALALLPAERVVAWLGAIPEAGLGALLLFAAIQLAATRRLVEARPSCWPAIGITAAVTLWLDPFAGLVCGTGLEILRRLVSGRAAGRAH